MELIAGEPNYVVQHVSRDVVNPVFLVDFSKHESGCRFTFDFTQVYWNSRLHTEHERLIQLFRSEEVIADVFAGVGPFAIPAAKKGCGVLANDLNPNSVKYLQKNVADNRVSLISPVQPGLLINGQQVSELVRVFCEDGREFIDKVVARALDEPFPAYVALSKRSRKRKEQALDHAAPDVVKTVITDSDRKLISHFVMNLPDSAIQFLDAFRGIFSRPVQGGRDLRGLYDIMPMIHCHCFTRELDPDMARMDIQKVCLSLASLSTLPFLIPLDSAWKRSWVTTCRKMFHFIWCDPSPQRKTCIALVSDCRPMSHLQTLPDDFGDRVAEQIPDL